MTGSHTTYWHGGMPGLKPGDTLLSREALARIGHHGAGRRRYDEVTLTDRVYFSHDQEFARAYANNFELATSAAGTISHGTLYEVQPVGSIEEDPDYAGVSVSWCAPSAIIVTVIATDVRMKYRDASRAIGQYCTWDDGRPMYHSDGRLNVTRQMESLGITQAQLDSFFRPWIHWESALDRVEQAYRQGKIGPRLEADGDPR